jgi:hypothetical protein
LSKLTISGNTFDVQLTFPDEKNRCSRFSNKTEVVIGKKTRDLFDITDQQLLGLHARLVLENSKVYLENLEGTTYIRLHPTDPLRITTTTNVKVGCTILHIECMNMCECCETIVVQGNILNKNPECLGNLSRPKI